MSAWIIASVSQPLSAVAFVTDGIHWGTGDYRYMRNGMVISTLIAAVMLYSINITAANAFMMVLDSAGRLDFRALDFWCDSCLARYRQCSDRQSTGAGKSGSKISGAN